MGANSKNVTLKEVAAAANTSLSAASVALSGRNCSTVVSDETRQRVVEVAQKMRYRPNMLGRSLASRRSFTIGLLCRQTMGSSAWQVIRGIQDRIGRIECSLVTYAHDNDVEREATHLKEALGRHVDGLIVMPVLDWQGRSNAKRFQTVARGGVPVVQLPHSTLDGVNAVRMDYYASGQIAAQHLLDLGHRDIRIVTHAHYDDTTIPRYWGRAFEQFQGFRDALHDAGCASDQPPVTFDIQPEKPVDWFAHGVEIGQRFRDRHPNTTGVVCCNDELALGMIEGLKSIGAHVPRDLSIIGFDNIDAASMGLTKLTTLAIPFQRIAQESARMLSKLIAEKDTQDRDVQTVTIAPEFIVRQSTRALR